MTSLHPSSSIVNPLGLVADPLLPLDSAEALLAVASRFALHGRTTDARMALGLFWSANHLAAIEAADPGRLALLSRAAREAEEALDDADALPVLGEVR